MRYYWIINHSSGGNVEIAQYDENNEWVFMGRRWNKSEPPRVDIIAPIMTPDTMKYHHPLVDCYDWVEKV